MLAAGGMSSPRAEPWEGSGCSSLRSEGRKNVLGKKEREEEERNGEGKVRLKPIGRGFLLAKEEVAPSPAEPRSLVAEEAPPPPPPPRSPALQLHTLGREGSSQFARSAAASSPPTPRFPPPCSSRLLPPSSPKPAASTDLSNGCTFLGAGRGVAERLNRGSKARGSERATPARRAPRQPAAWRAGRGGEKAELGGARRTAPLRCPGAIPAPGTHPWRSGQRCPLTHLALGRLRSRLRRIAAQQPTLRALAAGGVFLGATGLITVRHSREGVSGGGWGVKNANLSPYSLTDPAEPLRTPGQPGGWRKVARGSLDPPLRLCKVSAGAKARV